MSLRACRSIDNVHIIVLTGFKFAGNDAKSCGRGGSQGRGSQAYCAGKNSVWLLCELFFKARGMQEEQAREAQRLKEQQEAIKRKELQVRLSSCLLFSFN
jgi:hypothetical protein